MRIRWQRLRMVAGSREGCCATRIRTVRDGGSSSVLSKAFAAFQFKASAGSITATL